MKNKGEIFSFDLHESKLSLIEGGRDRLGLDIIKVNDRDARYPDESLLGTADKVICDVPCSGLGVLGKKPDLRHRDISAIKELPPLQARILENAADALAKDGVLVYSTCTLLPDENEEQVKAFLSRHPEFAVEPFTVGEAAFEGMVTLAPDTHGTDGFFISCLRKKDNT
jgi:16S rRNA (cytosine967-C5)-methyltransferase